MKLSSSLLVLALLCCFAPAVRAADPNHPDRSQPRTLRFVSRPAASFPGEHPPTLRHVSDSEQTISRSKVISPKMAAAFRIHNCTTQEIFIGRTSATKRSLSAPLNRFASSRSAAQSLPEVTR